MLEGEGVVGISQVPLSVPTGAAVAMVSNAPDDRGGRRAASSTAATRVAMLERPSDLVSELQLSLVAGSCTTQHVVGLLRGVAMRTAPNTSRNGGRCPDRAARRLVLLDVRVGGVVVSRTALNVDVAPPLLVLPLGAPGAAGATAEVQVPAVNGSRTEILPQIVVPSTNGAGGCTVTFFLTQPPRTFLLALVGDPISPSAAAGALGGTFSSTMGTVTPAPERTGVTVSGKDIIIEKKIVASLQEQTNRLTVIFPKSTVAAHVQRVLRCVTLECHNHLIATLGTVFDPDWAPVATVEVLVVDDATKAAHCVRAQARPIPGPTSSPTTVMRRRFSTIGPAAGLPHADAPAASLAAPSSLLVPTAPRAPRPPSTIGTATTARRSRMNSDTVEL
jgi:hypothetical protein